jgi:hypothetical protein
VIDALISNGGVSRIEALHTVDFSDPEEPHPAGLVTVHPLDAKVHPDSLTAVRYLAVVPVNGASFGEFDKDALNRAVPQFAASNPPSLRCRSTETKLDDKVWHPELGDDDLAFAGVFTQTKGRDVKHFICVQAGVPLATRQMREKMNLYTKRTGSPMTFDQLMSDPDYNYLHYIAQRNVQRLAYNVARTFKLPIRHTPDIGTKREFEHSGVPMMAKPAVLQPISTMVPITGTASVAVYNVASPMAKVDYVYEGPYHGIAVFNTKGVKGIALPAHSGRKSSVSAATLASAEISKRVSDAGIICEGGTPASHPNVSTEAFHRTDTEEFIDEMKTMGWKSHNMINLVPVVIKISDARLVRPQ